MPANLRALDRFGEDVCRIELNGGTYMDDPPPGNFRAILKVCRTYAEDIRNTWDAIHGG